MLHGGKTYKRKFALDETPGIHQIRLHNTPSCRKREDAAPQNDAPIAFTIYPESDSFMLYEDNGDDQKYDNEHAFTEVSSNRNHNMLTFTISARKGTYADMPASRRFEIRIPATARPLKVKSRRDRISIFL